MIYNNGRMTNVQTYVMCPECRSKDIHIEVSELYYGNIVPSFIKSKEVGPLYKTSDLPNNSEFVEESGRSAVCRSCYHEIANSEGYGDLLTYFEEMNIIICGRRDLTFKEIKLLLKATTFIF